MNELVFEVTQEADGGFVAECLRPAPFSVEDYSSASSAIGDHPRTMKEVELAIRSLY